MKYFLLISFSTVQTLTSISYPRTLLMLPVLGVVVVAEVLLSYGDGFRPAEARDNGDCPRPHPPVQRPAARLHHHIQRVQWTDEQTVELLSLLRNCKTETHFTR